MKKLALVVTIAAMAALNAQSAAHEKVQLWEGGPYWATTNIGAEKPEDYGLYFWWGDTTGHRPSGTTFSFNFSSSNTPTYKKTLATLQSEGWVVSQNGTYVLAPAHDAAHVHWGGSWRMPMYQELYDLCFNKCDWTWTTQNGVNGYVVRGRGDFAANSIFLPCSGWGFGSSLFSAGSYGRCLSSVPRSYDDCSWVLGFDSGFRNTGGNDRTFGFSVRPVQGFGEVTDCVIRFNANGGVFKDKEGSAVTQFDQHFTYGESKPLFTDELTPMRMDENGNVFLGWSKGTPNISSSDQLIASGREWTWDDDETEVTFYAVWTTTVTVWFYNEETTSGDKSLSPSSLADHLHWSVDDGATGTPKTLRSGETIEVSPGYRTVTFHGDNAYYWIAGLRTVDGVAVDTFKLNICNDYTDALFGSTPSRKGISLYVKVEPPSGAENTASVRFLCSNEIRESLRDRIKAEDVPFDPSKVRITIGRADYNPSGILVPMMAYSMTGLEAYRTYYLPKGHYYVKYEDVTYDVDTSGGEPYWGAALESNFERQLFELSDEDNEAVKKITVRFDMFGGRNAVRVEFDPQGGECAKSEMWFTYHEGNYQPGPRIDKTLPTPEREGFEFSGWFTAKSGGQWKKEGSDISDCMLFAHWTGMTREWMEENARALFPDLADLDVATVANTAAANGCRTVGECYALGIDPEDPDDDLKIAEFTIKDGKPEITLNHTKDGSGNSFEDRMRTLGKKSLTDPDWVDITGIDQSEYRFFMVAVDIDNGGGDNGGGSGGEVNMDGFVIEQGVLQRYVGDAVDVVIPSSVTSIGEFAFAGNTNLVSVTIPDSVTNVGAYAFGFCSDLATASLPVSLEGSLVDSVFSGCSGDLRIVYWSASVGTKSINVNFTNGNALDAVNYADALVGAEGYAVPCSVWDNVVGTNSVNLVRVYQEGSGDFVGEADVSLEIAGSRGYWTCWDLASSNSLLYAYVDDIVGSTCPTLTVSNIPFANCRVVIYASSDSENANFGHYTINGVNVTGNDSSYGTEHWGDAGPWYSSQPLAKGVNYVVSPVIALGEGGVLSIATHNARGVSMVLSTRGTIAAIQIVETKEMPTRRTVAFDLGGYGLRIGGGELVQTVAEGAAAVAPQVAVTDGLALVGWDADFSCVTNDLTVTARYAAMEAVTRTKSINVNFTDGNALDAVNYADALVGAEGYAVPCSVWDNVVGTNSVNLVRVYQESSGDFVGEADVSLEISGSRGYWTCPNLASSNSLLYAYVDDIVGSTCPTLTVSNIPFANCRVVIYASSDSENANFGHYTINGVNVTGNDSSYGTEHWGDAGPWYSSQPLAQGVNYVVSPVIALGEGGVLSIATHNARGVSMVLSTRGTIAAIQIVEIE